MCAYPSDGFERRTAERSANKVGFKLSIAALIAFEDAPNYHLNALRNKCEIQQIRSDKCYKANTSFFSK